jgi:hypothetical protein
MNLMDLEPLAAQAAHALTVCYSPAINQAAETISIPEGMWYGWLMAAHIFEPEPVSAQRLQVRSAYTSLERLDEYLAQGATMGLLEPSARGEYRLSPAGHAAVKQLIKAAYDAMAPLRPLPVEDLDCLAGLLQRLVLASMAAPEPPGKWCLRMARHYDPGNGAPVMVRLDQYLSDLSAYRDDAHLAAWQPYGVGGEAWDAFTHFWRGDVTTLDELPAHLARRGHTRAAYAAGVQELMARGWVAGDGMHYHLTERGRILRDEAEATTDKYFYAPWNCLSDDEVGQLRHLLTGMRDGLRRLSA